MPFHKVYEFVERITREINFVEFWQSTQKMCLDLRNTLDPELDLQHAAFKGYALHKVYEFVETCELNVVEFWQSTYASGPKEHARPGIGPPAHRV